MFVNTSVFALLQVPTYTMSDGQFHLLLWFTGLIAFWLFLQAIALVAVAIMVVRLLSKVDEISTKFEQKALAVTDRFEKKLYPLLDNVQNVMNDSVPKIKRVTDNIADTTDVYRAKLAEVDEFLTDTAQKVKRQSDELDRIVTTTLHTAGNFVGRVEQTVMTPIRQGSAILSGLKAATERLVENFRPAEHTVPTTPKPVAFEGENIYTGLEDDYHA